MSNVVKLTRFTDFDRLMDLKNLLITIIGAAGAFSISYFQLYLPVPFIPFGLSLSLALMICVAIYTKNIASTILVALIGSIGLVPVTKSGSAEWILGYILVNVILLLILGYYSNKLQLVMKWTRFYLLFGIVISLISIGFGVVFNPLVSEYWNRGIPIGTGGDYDTGIGYPILDIGLFAALLVLTFFVFFLTRGQRLLEDKSVGTYRFFGAFFLIIGQLVTLTPIVYWFREIDSSVMEQIARIDRHLATIVDLFTHTTGTYAVYGEFVNIFFVIAVTTVFTMIGISLLMIAKHQGNLEGVQGGSSIAFLAAPLAFVLYFAWGNYFIQTLIIQDGFFISIELFPLFATMIWSVYYLNQIVSRILLFILDKI